MTARENPDNPDKNADMDRWFCKSSAYGNNNALDLIFIREESPYL